tara:strand:+ start:619 stop:1425 length:807 start_codon:yes stop_codon:yes gene_type:complete
MPDFLDPKLRTPNIPQPRFAPKIRLQKNDVSLQFLLASDIGKSYKVVMLVNIVPGNVREKDPSRILAASTIDMNSLRSAILSNVSPFDKTYMILKEYDTRKATFIFDHEKWLRESVSDTNTTLIVTRFAREFKLKKAIPSMIFNDPLRMYFDKFLLRKFKEYMEKYNKEAKWFKFLFPETTTRLKLRRRMKNMFDWEYDYTWNRVTAVLKPMYVLAVIFATGLMVKKMRESDIKQVNKEKLFALKVKQDLKKFDYGKFDKYHKRRGYI